ncbi:MAG: flagellar hook-basal body complex protein FliE [Deltaproteobacteria bacterium]|nr:flagellar hook-basal body complex protein FliE [Deltaproteobacteria bacterium]MBW2018950.1 flagellar hook-basal body complex protein FliE [Deltaproteobacteria bacterium]MBW2073165.1 flagellar hook-basal body complex protein FliE [Deltaproteobacteria bacterium]RLB83785.1 MAG: flagellar hook-basal body complex protein FliE [Deltaproteobacteria bacterium]
MSDLRVLDKLHVGRSPADRKNRTSPGNFGDVIKQAIKHVSDMEIRADQSIEQLLKGETGIHETMIALQKSDISLRLFLQVRNKVMDAYREIMRMQF